MATELDTTGLGEDIARYIQSTIGALKASHGKDIPELYAEEMQKLSVLLKNIDSDTAAKIITEKTHALFPDIANNIVKFNRTPLSLPNSR
jgi:hypothetical protein